jgi:hypothetical protein
VGSVGPKFVAVGSTIGRIGKHQGNMADSRRKLNMNRLRPVAPLQIPEIEAERDETVGCLRYSVLAAIGLLVLALVAVVAVFVVVQMEQRTKAAPNANAPLPPGGITVAVKQIDPALTVPQLEKLDGTGEPAPVAGFAIDLGSALSFGDLSRRFAEIASQNAELQLDRLEPRATLKETIDGLEARLLVGPFETMAEAIDTCRNIALPSGIECRAVNFSGARIARE